MSVKNLSNAQVATAKQAQARSSRFFWLLSAGLLVLGLLFSAMAQAQGSKIGFVNTERILRDSIPAKAAQTKIEAEFKKREDDLQKLAANLRNLAQKFEKDAPVLSESDRNKRQRELANLDADIQRKRREFQEDFNRRRNEEFASIVEKANAAIKRIAEQENYDVILQDAVTVSPRIDITDKVIQALGK
jgi:outer membrane protein